MEDLFYTYFPLGIAHKNALVSFVFSPEFKDCPIKSAFWKFFLIIFPQSKEKTILSEEWMSTLSFNRMQFDTIKQIPTNGQTEIYRDIILQGLGASFMQSIGSIKKEILSGLSDVLFYFLGHLNYSNGTISNNIAECICSLAAKFYVQFNSDSVEANDSEETPYQFLMSKKYIFHDIFTCLRAALVQVSSFIDDESPFFASQNSRYITNAFTNFKNGPPMQPQDDLRKIYQFYRTIFWARGYSWNELSILASIVFSQFPETNIFHLVYAWVISHGHSIQEQIDISTMTTDVAGIVGKSGLYYVDLRHAVSSIQQLEELIEKNFSEKTRYIVQQHMKMLSKYISGKVRWENLIPIDIYSKL